MARRTDVHLSDKCVTWMIFKHNAHGDTLGVDRGQVGVLEEGNEVRLSSLLESHDGRRLEAQVGLKRCIASIRHNPKKEGTRFRSANLEVLRDLTDEPLEGELPDKQLRRLLVTTDFTKSDGTRPEAMGLLDTTSRGLQSSMLVCMTHSDDVAKGVLWGERRPPHKGDSPGVSSWQPWSPIAYAEPCLKFRKEKMVRIVGEGRYVSCLTSGGLAGGLLLTTTTMSGHSRRSKDEMANKPWYGPFGCSKSVLDD